MSRNLDRLPEVLFEIGKAIGSDKGLEHLFERISELVCSLMDADACSVMLLDSSRTVLLGKAAHGLAAGRIHQISFRTGEGVAGWVADHGVPARIDDCLADERFVHFEGDGASRIRSMLCVPLLARDRTVGVLTVTDREVSRFHEADVELLGFIGKTIALDMENMRLRKMSVTDPLTGAYNREFLGQRLPAELSLAIQRGQALSVAMIDVDHFKTVNDRYGHAVGDAVLLEVADRLRGAIRKGDLLVRYGGEEFLAVLPDATLERAREAGERMRAALMGEAISVAGGDTLEVRVSVGVAELSPGDDETTLIRRADTALDQAKGRGRNRVETAGEHGRQQDTAE